MPKRILILSLNYYPRFVGGAEVAIKEITDRLPADEYEFHLVTLRFDTNLLAEEKIGNVVVHRMGFATKNPSIADLRRFPLHLNKYWYQIAAARTAAALHTRYNFSCIWAMTAHGAGIPAARFKKRFPHIPYLLTLQEGDPLEEIERTMKPVWPLFVAAFSRADRVQAISQFLGAWARYRGAHAPVELIPNGVDGAHFAKVISDAERAAWRAAMSVENQQVVLVTTSRLVHKNGIDTILQAMPQMPEEVLLFIYGIGPDEEKLRTLVSELRIDHRVRFMGHVTHDELPRILHACDIFVRPSRSEGMGNSFIEAMAAGVPVIGTQVGGISDFLFSRDRSSDHAATGWIVDVDAPEQVAAAVQQIMLYPEQRKEVVRTAQKMALSTYDWNQVSIQMKRIFDDLTGS